MAQPWLRLYREVVTDPKLCRLSGSARFVWIVLMCLANDDGDVLIADGVPYDRADIANLAGVANDTVDDAFEWFIKTKMINTDALGLIKLNNWNKRQFKSDDSTERVRKHRAKQVCNGDVTPSDTDTDTEADTDKSKGTRARFKPPTLDELRAHVAEKGYTFDPETFIAHYTANGWKVGGRSAMKSWEATCVTWQKREGPRKATDDDEWVCESYRRVDMTAHGADAVRCAHPRWEEYIAASANYPARTAPRFADWLETA